MRLRTDFLGEDRTGLSFRRMPGPGRGWQEVSALGYIAAREQLSAESCHEEIRLPLDARACAIFREWASFQPVAGPDGRPVKAAYAERMTWSLGE